MCLCICVDCCHSCYEAVVFHHLIHLVDGFHCLIRTHCITVGDEHELAVCILVVECIVHPSPELPSRLGNSGLRCTIGTFTTTKDATQPSSLLRPPTMGPPSDWRWNIDKYDNNISPELLGRFRVAHENAVRSILCYRIDFKHNPFFIIYPIFSWKNCSSTSVYNSFDGIKKFYLFFCFSF